MSDFTFKAIDPDENVLYEWTDVRPHHIARLANIGEPVYIDAVFRLPLPESSETQEIVFLDIYVWGMHYERKRIEAPQLSTERGRPWLVVTPGETATIHQRMQIS